MFGHDNDHNTNSLLGAPLPPEPVADDILTANVPATSQAPVNDAPPPDDGLASDPFPASAPKVDDDLLAIKQQALQQLTPLVGHLSQTPEEKFRTTMMMIQGSDNQVLIKDAYDAAQKITDEKARAQALLDVVNEINYFTQHSANTAS